MTPAQTGAPDYDARIRRAQHLAAKHAFAAQILAFYQYLAVFQKHLYTQLPQNANRAAVNPTKPSADFRSQLDLAVLLQHFPDLLSLLQRVGPMPVAGAARPLALQGPPAGRRPRSLSPLQLCGTARRPSPGRRWRQAQSRLLLLSL